MVRARFFRLLTAAAVAATVAAASAAAPPEPTAAEKLYEKLKDAEKQADRQLAERWYGLVRQRQWSDKSGKYKTFARYVDHDPNLAWVKLSIFVKKGDQVSYKETTIPLAKLGKNEQALVKRISMVRPQIEKAAAGAPDAPLGIAEEGAIGVPAEAEAMEAALRSGALPPGVELTAIPPTGLPPGGEVPPSQPADETWRTDFAAFAANLAPPGAEDPAPGWGELHALKAVNDKERMLAMMKAAPAEMRPPRALLMQQGFAYGWARAALGEVRWQATFTGSSAGAAGELQHDLQVPSPWQLSLIADPDYAGGAERFATGGPTSFIGRFAEVGGGGATPHIKLYVRLPGDKRK